MRSVKYPAKDLLMAVVDQAREDYSKLQDKGLIEDGRFNRDAFEEKYVLNYYREPAHYVELIHFFNSRYLDVILEWADADNHASRIRRSIGCESR